MVQPYGAVLPVSRNGYVPVCAFRMGTVSPNYDRYPTRLPVTDLQHRRKAFFVGIFCLGVLLLLFAFLLRIYLFVLGLCLALHVRQWVGLVGPIVGLPTIFLKLVA